jgi:hypothetical protein
MAETFHPGQELAHWVATEQLPLPLILRHLTWQDAVRLAFASPQLWPRVARLVTLAQPDTAAAFAGTTPDRLRIPLLTGLTREQVRAGNNWALRWACEGGHLATAQWLTATFQLTDADARDADALLMACQYGHLAVVAWLETRFGITQGEITN